MRHRTRLVSSLLLAIACSAPAAGGEAKPRRNPKPAPTPATVAPATSAENPELAELMKRFQADPANISEADVTRLLALALDGGQVYAAAQALRSYNKSVASVEFNQLAADVSYAAGEYVLAAARLKTLAQLPGLGDEPRNRANARLYHILIDLLGYEDDAYQVMLRSWSTGRASAAVKRFDAWFLDQSIKRNDLATMATTLGAIFAEKQPIEQERWFFWDALDALMSRARAAGPEAIAAAAPIRDLVTQVRDSEPRRLRYAFIAAHLTWIESTSAADAPDAGSFAPVAAAARAYLDAVPTAPVLNDIARAFAGSATGAGFDDKKWARLASAKRAVIAYGLTKLAKAEVRAFTDWQREPGRGDRLVDALGTPEDWAGAGISEPAIHPGSAWVQPPAFIRDADAPAKLKTFAQTLADVPTPYAAVIQALAAGDDPAAGFAAFAQHTWHLDAAKLGAFIENGLWAGYRARGVKRADFDKAFGIAGETLVAGSPAAVADPGVVDAWLRAAWSSAADRGAFAKQLGLIAWVPWSSNDDRDRALGGIRNEINRWAGQVRDDLKDKTRAAKLPAGAEAAAKSLPAAMQAQFERKGGDPAAATGAAQQPFAQLVNAANQDAYVAPATALYAAVRDYSAKRTPFGRAYLQALVQPRRGFDPFDRHLEVLADQLALALPDAVSGFHADGAARQVVWTATAFFSARANWPWWIPGRDKDKAAKANTVFAKALRDQIAAGKVGLWLFDWFLATSKGDGFHHSDAHGDVLTAIVEKDLFRGLGYNPVKDRPGLRSASAVYLAMMGNDYFPKLMTKVGIAAPFDAESTQRAFLDPGVLDLVNQKFVFATAAKVLAGYKTLPLGHALPFALTGDAGSGTAGRYNPAATSYSRSELARWLAQTGEADPAHRQALIAAAESAAGSRFDDLALGATALAKQSAKSPEERAAWFKRFAVFLDRIATLPHRVQLPPLESLRDIDAKTLTADEVATLLAVFADRQPQRYDGGRNSSQLARLLSGALVAQNRWSDLVRVAGHLWKIAADSGDQHFARELTALAIQLNAVGNQGSSLATDRAAVIASIGLNIGRGVLSEDLRNQLQGLQTVAAGRVGAELISVAETDAKYPVFAAQNAWRSGRAETAWKAYRAALPTTLGTMLATVDPEFSLWVVRNHTELGEFDKATQVLRLLDLAVEKGQVRNDIDYRGRLRLADADIAAAEKNLPLARAKYLAVAESSDFDGSRTKLQAELSVAGVDRMAKNYDSAESLLNRIKKRPDTTAQVEAHYHLALLKIDQEQYKEAKDLIDAVLTRDPNHALANIALGELNFRLRNFEEGSIVTVEGSQKRRTVEPGRPLRISLVDKNLSVVGRSGLVEMQVWVEGGDAEKISLVPVGDSQTKFSQEVPTVLGAAKKGDGLLQIHGGQTVLVRYSDRFIADNRIKDVPAPGRLEVVTDGEFYASSGEILTREQLERMRREDEIKRLLRIDEEEEGEGSLADRRLGSQVKPGNVINLKLIDLDRDLSDARDTVTVKVKARSGDGIEALVLTETGEHTGTFENTVRTATSSPVAIASDSSPGAEPNAVISPAQHPAWVALPNERARTKIFTIDLNDSVQLGALELITRESGRRLKDFFVQTSLGGRGFRTVAHWPAAFTPWDGALRLRAMRPSSSVRAAEELLPEFDLATTASAMPAAKTFALDWAKDATPLIDKLKNKNDKNDKTQPVALHLQGAFTMPERANRVLRVVPSRPLGATARVKLLIDGQPGDGRGENAGPLTVARRLGKGVHTIDLVGVFDVNDKVSFSLVWDVDQQMAPAAGDAFDPAKHEELKALARPSLTIAENQAKDGFAIPFTGETARLVRFIITAYEGDAPAISKVTLADAKGAPVLPTKEDFQQLRRNDLLEIIPGDLIDLSYADPSPAAESRKVLDQQLTATYSNAVLSACFVTFIDSGEGQVPAYTPMKRFAVGDTIKVFVNDADMDVTPEKDTVTVNATTTAGKKVTVKALETGEHSGVFIATVLPVAGEAKRSEELTIATGDDVTLAYLDKENTDQGIPWQRGALVEQVFWQDPVLQVYDLVASAAPAKDDDAAPGRASRAAIASDELVRPAFAITATLLPLGKPGEPVPAVGTIIGGPVMIEFVHPLVAKSSSSSLEVFAQTSSGRRLAAARRTGAPGGAGAGADTGFHITVPGTVRVAAVLGGAGGTPPLGYLPITVDRGTAVRSDPLDEGRFSAAIQTRLGAVPEKSLATPEALKAAKDEDDRILAVNGDDTIFLAVRYQDREGKERWATREVGLRGEAMFDVMNRLYVKPVESAYIGESVFLRVVDPTADRSDQKDSVTVQVTASSGATARLDLVETYSHSGIFKGIGKLTYAEGEVGELGAVPTRYGDTITFAYRTGAPSSPASPSANAATASGTDGKPALTRQVVVHKGSDARVMAFTKHFNDPSIAVRTQFALSESYFEVAKKHREQAGDARKEGKEAQAEQLTGLARREIGLGKKLLDEVVRDYPDSDIRAQTDYLRGNLEMEYANDVADEESRKKHYKESITLFGNILASYPDSEYAPKAQFKKALSFEKMGDLDQACEEYVKLSYRYPDNELVAETIARLGRYFLTKGKAMDDEAKALTKSDAVKGEGVARQARSFYRTAGEVFSRLKPKFPQHQLAAKTTVLSGMCLMRAQEHERATQAFSEVIDDKAIEDKALVAEAMYWSGSNYLAMADLRTSGRAPVAGAKEVADPLAEAFRILKRLTWDHPESEWAKYARGLLAQDKRLMLVEK